MILSAIHSQRWYRGRVSRLYAAKIRRLRCNLAVCAQRITRGHIGRRIARERREFLHRCATTCQSLVRGHCSRIHTRYDFLHSFIRMPPVLLAQPASCIFNSELAKAVSVSSAIATRAATRLQAQFRRRAAIKVSSIFQWCAHA